MPIYGPPISNVSGITIDGDGFITAANNLPFKLTVEPIVNDPMGATRRLKLTVKDQGVQKEFTRVDK